MPVLSLHNTYSLPSGSASYTLGLSGAPGASSYSTYPSVGQSGLAGLSSVLGAGLSSGLGVGHSSVLGTTGLNLSSTNPLSSGISGLGASALTSLGLGYSSSYSTYTNPLLTSGAIKLRTLDDFDIGISRFNPGFMHTHSQSRPISRIGRFDDYDSEYNVALNLTKMKTFFLLLLFYLTFYFNFRQNPNSLSLSSLSLNVVFN